MYIPLAIPILILSSVIPVSSLTTTVPTVTIPDGTITGSRSNGIDTFKGIPYADPPIGPLRLRPPQPLSKPFLSLNATSIPRACPQLSTPIYLGDLAGEDCLTLNIHRPSHTLPTSRLPVLIWLYGGGFQIGSTQGYDGTRTVQKAISLGRPLIFVAINYRLGAFGFLPGRQLQADGSTNLGLRDQRLGMRWVQDNIERFGGDAARVTIWGESAGAVAVFDHMIIEGGDHMYKGKPLFRGAIMNSGSIGPGVHVAHPKPQGVFDAVAAKAGCLAAGKGGGGDGDGDVLGCLRNASYETLLTASNSVPGIFTYRSLDLSYLPRPDPSSTFLALSQPAALAAGRFAKVPCIIGNQEDEGTLFAQYQHNLTTTADLLEYLTSYFPNLSSPPNTNLSGSSSSSASNDTPSSQDNTSSLLRALLATYTSSPTSLYESSPYSTGTSWNVYPQYKHLASFLGDYFTLTRRIQLSYLATAGVPVWSYLNANLRTLPVMGTYHSSELPGVFGNAALGLPVPRTLGWYIGFVDTGEVNAGWLEGEEKGDGEEGEVVWWPRWVNCSREMIEVGARGVRVIKDDFREAQYREWDRSLGVLEV